MGSEEAKQQVPNVVMVAASKHSGSIAALKWTLSKKLVHEGCVLTLLHVRPPVLSIPNPMGAQVPVDQLSPEVVAAYILDINSSIEEDLHTHKKLCREYKVKPELIIVENDNVAKGIVDQISELKANEFIIGKSAGSFIRRKMKRDSIPEYVLKHASDHCSVQVICNGQVICIKEAAESTTKSTSDSDAANLKGGDPSLSSKETIPNKNKFVTISRSHPALSIFSQSLPRQRERSASIINFKRGTSSVDFWDPHHLEFLYPDISQRCEPTIKDQDYVTSSRHGTLNQEFVESSIHERGSIDVENDPDCGKNDERLTDTGPDENQCVEPVDNNLSCETFQVEQVVKHQQDEMFDLERLKHELDEAQQRLIAAEQAAALAAQKAKELDAFAKQEAKKKEQALIVAQLAKREAAEESKKYDDALIALEAAKLLAEEEAERRKEAEERAHKETLIRQKAIDALQESKLRYREYDYEDLKAATGDFSITNRIGLGGYGSVYKGRLHHTTVAIKVLRQDSLQGPKEFQQEIEVLSRMHHPHMVLLFGACPEKGCLVYEYLANGSLEDRLRCKGNSKPLPWYTRFRIAAEVATALLFLHSSKPDPYVHRDLKPANILLDQNMSSKIGDVGLARLAPGVSYTSVTEYRDTTPVGTFAYIDPEYQRTGIFTPRSDVYAFGLVLLQLLTRQDAVGLVDHVEHSLEKGKIADVLDPAAGDWPISQATEMAKIAIQCSEMRRKKRPDIETVLRQIEKLKTFADDYVAQMAWSQQEFTSESRRVVPNFFICPISKDIMEDPHIAADGFTYEYASIKHWLQNHKTSPMTNLKLKHKQLTPNHSLCSAIQEWKQKMSMSFA